MSTAHPQLPPERWLWQQLEATLDQPSFAQLRAAYEQHRRAYNAAQRRQREQACLQRLRTTLQTSIRTLGADHPSIAATRQAVERLSARLGESEAA